MMTPAQVRVNQNPILTNLLLGLGQGTFIAEKLFPRLPQALSAITLKQMGTERFKRYNLRRAPGTPTKRVDIQFEGKVYSVDQYAVEVPIARELIREDEATRTLNVGNNLEISGIAIATAGDILGLDYELDVSALATNPATYAPGHVVALAGGTKWSALTGTPVTDVLAGSNVIRKKIGKRPNKLFLSADAAVAVGTNVEVRGYLPSTQMAGPTLEQLKAIFQVKDIEIGDAIFMDGANAGQDVWGNAAVLAYVPTIGGAGTGGSSFSLSEPAFGFTNVIEGHPFAETPYYEAGSKSYIYGATFERRPNIAYNTAAFLFQNPK